MLAITKKLMTALVAVSLVAIGGASTATELVYKPVNPSFGGNSLNGTYLLNKATSQDKNEDPDANEEESALEDFASSLQSRVLSVLSQRIANRLLGEEDLPEGTIVVGDFEIEITDNIDVLDVTIRDSAGNETSVEIPSNL